MMFAQIVTFVFQMWFLFVSQKSDLSVAFCHGAGSSVSEKIF